MQEISTENEGIYPYTSRIIVLIPKFEVFIWTYFMILFIRDLYITILFQGAKHYLLLSVC